MGHMLIVAIMSYLCSLEIDACDQRIRNNYFTALFHDLPEILTRDIISPVKKSVDGLDDIIKDIERCRNRDFVTHGIAPVLYKALFEEHVLLRRKRVLQQAGI